MSERLLAVGSAVRGMPIVAIQEGENLGQIRDIIYDSEAGAVVGFTLNKPGLFSGRRREVLETGDVHAIGQDAVMIAHSGMLKDPESAEEAVGAPETERNVLGNDVLTEGGTSLGTVVDVVLLTGPSRDGRAGDVVGYEVKLPAGGKRYIPLPAQVAISGAALVVPDATEAFICDGLDELSAKLHEYRERIEAPTVAMPAPDAPPTVVMPAPDAPPTLPLAAPEPDPTAPLGEPVDE